MEHRWGQRVGVDIPVRITGHPFTVRSGRLANLSVSGAFIRADLDVRLLSRVLVAIDLPQHPKNDAPMIPAFVARKLKDGIGIEWCEFKPQAITRLLQSTTARHYHHRGAGGAPPGISRFTAPLLKPGG